MEEQNITGLRQLIELFQHNLKQYKGKHYDEAKARADFIDKFFELLGWDVYNKKGYSANIWGRIVNLLIFSEKEMECGNIQNKVSVTYNHKEKVTVIRRFDPFIIFRVWSHCVFQILQSFP